MGGRRSGRVRGQPIDGSALYTTDVEECVWMSEDSIVSTEDTMRERVNENRVKIWVLLRANRLALATVLSAVVFVSFIVTVTVLHPPFAEQLESGDPIDTLFGAMIGVIVTGTTLVVTIGQLVLTQESGPLGDQQERMSNAMDFRDRTEDLTGSASPADPSTFLQVLISSAVDRARALEDSVKDSHAAALREEVDQLVGNILGNAKEVDEQLDRAQFGSFDVLFAALNFNYSLKIFQIERLRNEYGESLSEEALTDLDELKTALSLFAPAREHIKTLYFQWALINLSKLILYAAIPALAVAGIMLTMLDVATVPGALAGVEYITILVGAAFAVTLFPFMVFVSYMLRILTVAKRTLAIEPLILRHSQDS